MFSWRKPHKEQASELESIDKDSTMSEHIELKEELTYPSTQDTIELKDLPESKVSNRTQGGFELKPESSASPAPSAPSASIKKERSVQPLDRATAKVDSGEHEKYVLLFDLDGTLLDSIDGIYHSFIHACGVDFSPTLDEVRALIGLPLAEMFVKVGFDRREAQNRAIVYKNHYRQIYLQKTKLLPNVIESLIMAKGFAHLGVVTTKTALYSKHILQHFDILQFFQVVIGSEDVQHPKPSAEPILKALCSLPIVPKEQVFMIGDTIYDLEAAKNAQINSVWVRSGYGVGLESSAMMSYDGVYEAVSAIRAQAKQHEESWHTAQ